VARRLERARWFLWAAFASFPSGFVAVLCGWFTAEVGRQPWVVYGLLRTRDAVTPSLTTGQVLVSLAIYGFGLFYIYRLLRDGPADEGESHGYGTPGRPAAVALSSGERRGAV
jgi:cytochrome bd ubiquinol oxidase subunit I